MEIFETRVLNRIRFMVEEAQREKKFYFLVGDTGIGKTTGFLDYSSYQPSVITVAVKPAESMRFFFSKLLAKTSGENALNLYKRSGRIIHEFIEETSFELLKSSHDPLLIIDEVGNIKRNYIPYIRQIRDNTEGEAGIIIASPMDFYKRLMKWSDNGVAGMSELISRIDHVEFLPQTNLSDFKNLCRSRNIHDRKVWLWLDQNCDNLRTAKNFLDGYSKGRYSIG